jgi:hypothetical protein
MANAYRDELNEIYSVLEVRFAHELAKRGKTPVSWKIEQLHGMPEQDGTVNAIANTMDWLQDEIAAVDDQEDGE